MIVKISSIDLNSKDAYKATSGNFKTEENSILEMVSMFSIDIKGQNLEELNAKMVKIFSHNIWW